MGCPACKVVLCAVKHRVVTPSTPGQLLENRLREVCVGVKDAIGLLHQTAPDDFDHILECLDAQPMSEEQRSWLDTYLDETLCVP